MTSCQWPLLALGILLCASAACAAPVPISKWTLAPSCNVTATPEQISSADYVATGWYNITVPCTVMACLLQNGFYPDIFHGQNMANVPAAQFNQTWWCDAIALSPLLSLHTFSLTLS
jgi:exo-1,4-beta-D-glucosaminidase